MKIQIPTNRQKIRKDYLSVINGLLKLTPTELNVVYILSTIDKNNPCTKDNRIKAASELGWSRAVLNNTIKALKDKKVLLYDKETRKYSFHPLVLRVPEEDTTLVSYLLSFEFQIHAE
jgi:hypothetical protein|tara:strand:+ start:204 stop:557 length:354 start_codon:yes stop_codon:yes gene_type:complete